MAEVRIEKMNKVYDNKFHAVVDLDLEIRDGEFLVLVGPSGCGKSTALRMVAGLEDITSGSLSLDGKRLNEMAPKDRDMAMVFQNYALYPQMTVAENIAFPLKLRKVAKKEREAKVQEAARILELTSLLDNKPGQLSGGQRQRVAMGRAIVRSPSVFLMDEPLSNLDARLRIQMRADSAEIQRSLGVTTIYVTHDQVEAMTMGDRVAVLKGGHLQQVAPPEELYAHPSNVFVAGFIGAPSMNLFVAELVEDQQTGNPQLVVGAHQIALDASLFSRRPSLRAYLGSRLVLGIRPEDIADASIPGQSFEGASLDVQVEIREALGSETYIQFDLAPHVNIGDPDAEEGAGGRSSRRCTARLSPLSAAKVGSQIRLVVNTSNLHFFDLQTHMAIR